MTPFKIDESRAETLTRQVARGFREAIRSGFYKVGETLPPRNVASRMLGVSECVIRAAYSELVADRLVCSRPRLGFRVIGKAKSKDGKLVLDVESGHLGSYAARVSAEEFARYLCNRGMDVRTVLLGSDPRETPYLKPLAEALSLKPDFVLIRTNATSRKVVTRAVAEAGCPYATVLMGRGASMPGRNVLSFHLTFAEQIEDLVADCVRGGIRSVLQVDFGRDTYINAEPMLKARGISVERLCVDMTGPRNFDYLVARACDSVTRRLSCGRLPDLMLVTDDFLALGACEALRRVRIRVPQDLKMVIHVNLGSGLFPFGDYARFECDPRANGIALGRCVERWLRDGSVTGFRDVCVYRRGKSFPCG